MTKAIGMVAALAAAVVLAGCRGGEKAEAPSAPATAATPPAATARAGDPRGQIFIDKGCVTCHKVTALGVEGQEIGPDLSVAATDVKARFGTDLESFLKNPTGTMQIVLTQQIKLTDEERERIIDVLEDLGEDDKKADRK